MMSSDSRPPVTFRGCVFLLSLSFHGRRSPRAGVQLSAAGSDHLPGPQPGDRSRPIPELRQDLVRVLAKSGRVVTEAPRSL